jgi:hypothetical protein
MKLRKVPTISSTRATADQTSSENQRCKRAGAH